MRAKFINEIFSDESDPINDMDIGIINIIKKFVKEFWGDEPRENWIWICARLGKAEYVNTLLNKKNNEESLETAISGACENGHLEVVKLLVEKGKVPVNYNSKHRPGADYEVPINVACRYNNLDIVKYLLERGADPNGGKDGDALINCFWFPNHLNIAELLLKAGAKIGKSELEYIQSEKKKRSRRNTKLPEIIKLVEKYKNQINESFTDESDPIDDIGIGILKVHRDFEDNFKRYDWIIFILPKLLRKKAIPEDVLTYINDSHPILNRETYYETIREYIEEYTTCNGEVTWDSSVLALMIRVKLNSTNESFAEESDPIRDMGIGINIYEHRDFKTTKQRNEWLVLVLPLILDLEEIPNDLLHRDGPYLINTKYYDMISNYMYDYTTIDGSTSWSSSSFYNFFLNRFPRLRPEGMQN